MLQKSCTVPKANWQKAEGDYPGSPSTKIVLEGPDRDDIGLLGGDGLGGGQNARKCRIIRHFLKAESTNLKLS